MKSKFEMQSSKCKNIKLKLVTIWLAKNADFKMGISPVPNQDMSIMFIMVINRNHDNRDYTDFSKKAQIYLTFSWKPIFLLRLFPEKILFRLTGGVKIIADSRYF